MLPSSRGSRDPRLDANWTRHKLAAQAGVSPTTAKRVLSLANSRPDVCVQTLAFLCA
ncbi:MAG: hypothetical protein ACE5HA_08985 [Anaerolineae bacterium]